MDLTFYEGIRWGNYSLRHERPTAKQSVGDSTVKVVINSDRLEEIFLDRRRTWPTAVCVQIREHVHVPLVAQNSGGSTEYSTVMVMIVLRYHCASLISSCLQSVHVGLSLLPNICICSMTMPRPLGGGIKR